MAKQKKTRKSNVRKDGRDAKGRFLPGTSGNPRGRPKTKLEIPETFGELCADILLEPRPYTNAAGKTRKITLYEEIVRAMITKIKEAKPRDMFEMLRKLDERALVYTMREKLSDEPEPIFLSEEERRTLEIIWQSVGLDEAGTG